MKYLSWNETAITDFSSEKIGEMYENGYVFTRIGRGIMQQTRSVRINLDKFELSSENRRILKKVINLRLESIKLPLKDYNYTIPKMAKDFYDKKFGHGIMSAQKIKEMLTDPNKSNFNRLLMFTPETSLLEIGHASYAICFAAPRFLHYSYPFYDLNNSSKDIGLGMMVMTIQHAKEFGLKYIYLGSLQRPTDIYKLQFSGLEWFDGKNWSTDIEQIKSILLC